MTNDELLLSISRIIEPLREDIQGVKGDVKGLKGEFQELKGDVQGLKEDVQGLKEDVQELKTRVTKIEITQENEILPRLSTIESCYTSTYDRYKNSIDEHETMKQDIAIMKKIVADHSEKLQKIG